MDNKTAVFTISKSSATAQGRRYNITSKRFNLYNKIDVPESQLFDALAELSDTFNNVIDMAIVFEID
jgi:hypothetical protein